MKGACVFSSVDRRATTAAFREEVCQENALRLSSSLFLFFQSSVLHQRVHRRPAFYSFPQRFPSSRLISVALPSLTHTHSHTHRDREEGPLHRVGGCVWVSVCVCLSVF